MNTMKPVVNKIESLEHKENFFNKRKGLKVLQHTATDKENLVGRTIHTDKDLKLGGFEKTDTKTKKINIAHQAVQVGCGQIDPQDLTSDEPSADYWRRLAEKREEQLNDSLVENDRLNTTIEALKEENRICKEMLDESKHLVDVLQEMLEEGDQNESEADAAT